MSPRPAEPGSPPSTDGVPGADVAAARLDPARLPMAGIPPRLLMLAGALVVASWLVLSFARQVGEAASAGARADALRAGNVALEREVEDLAAELERIQDPRYIAFVARGYRLGSPDEIPFSLEADAPALPADAPGSASVRVGAEPASSSPLESWLRLLFGPGG